METGLAGYDAACAAIATAKNVDEVKQIHDKAEAVRAYARQAKNKTLEIDAVEIRIRAERRLGELLAVMPKATGAKGIGNPKSALVKREHTATLKQMGVSMDLSARAQRLAAMTKGFAHAGDCCASLSFPYALVRQTVANCATTSWTTTAGPIRRGSCRLRAQPLVRQGRIRATKPHQSAGGSPPLIRWNWPWRTQRAPVRRTASPQGAQR